MNIYLGNKGGKGGSSSAKTPTEDPNNLISKSTVRIIDIISEGPIQGLRNGMRDIYLDNTPVQNNDGSFNYKGFTYDTRLGYPNQSYIPGFPTVENEVSIGVQVKYNTPSSSQINDEDADAVVVKIRVSALTSVDQKSGDIHGTSVDLAFDIKTVSGSFVQVGTMTISGKTTSTYERAQRLQLPEGGAPWTLRVRRITPDSQSSFLSNDTYFSSYTIVYDAKLSYMDSALMAYTIDSSQFGSNSPSRIVKVDGIISDVPSNYDPVARTYSGLWNGTFKKACHGNPAWVLWDIAVNNRYGLGDLIASTGLDKFGLNAIGMYCDERIPDGFGGTEPRFTFAGQITSLVDAAELLDSIASVWRGMIYWGTGSVMFTQDAPATAKKQVSPANVINGEFNYSGSALKTRHTAVFVQWNDPDDLGRSAIEVVQDDALIQKFGYRPVQIAAFGCYSRGQAHRMGEWLLDTEANETELVTYRASFDHADVRPGDIIDVADPYWSGARFGGRVVSSTLNSITIDKEIDITEDAGWIVAITMQDGSIEERELTNITASGVAVLTLASDLPSLPINGAMWIVQSPSLVPRKFRVLSNVEKGDNLYEITALFHDPTKYARIERNIRLDAPSYILTPTGPLKPPTGLSVKEFFKPIGSTFSPALTGAWTAPDDARVNNYEYQIQGPRDATWRQGVITNNLSFDDYPTDQGIYKFRVRSNALFAQSSEWVVFEGLIYGPAQPIDDVTGFSITNVGPTSILSWDAVQSPSLMAYEIRFSHSLSGVTWNNADVLVSSIPKDANNVSVSSRVGTYLIKAVTYAETYSANPDIIISEIAGILNTNVVATLQETPTLAGTFDDTQAVSGELRLANLSVFMSDWTTLAGVPFIGGGYVSEGYYYFDSSLDLGSVGQANVDVVYQYEALSTASVIATWLTLDSIPAMSVPSDDVTVTIETRTSLDNLIWSDWEKVKLGKYLFRSIQFRVYMTTTDPNITPNVFELHAIIDMEDRVANDYDITAPSGGIRITFTPPFMAPPSVAINGQGLATGDRYAMTNRDETGFDLRFFNSSGTAKSAVFDWIAKGYGYQQ